jgi:hypothetical protein
MPVCDQNTKKENSKRVRTLVGRTSLPVKKLVYVLNNEWKLSKLSIRSPKAEVVEIEHCRVSSRGFSYTIVLARERFKPFEHKALTTTLKGNTIMNEWQNIWALAASYAPPN